MSLPFNRNVNNGLITSNIPDKSVIEKMTQAGLNMSDNPFYKDVKNGRDIYDTQVGKFLVGGRNKNLMTGANKIVNGMEDPSFLAFSFGIENVDGSGLFGDEATSKNGNTNMLIALNKDRSYSALTYLRNAVGVENEHTQTGAEESGYKLTFQNQYTEMKKFVNGFKEITENHPYMFQSIDGLQDAYKLYMNMHKDSMLGGGKDTKIKITCLESMDLRMAALFDSYFRSVYDHKYRRMNIPNNILRFDCYVLLHDIRNIAMDNPNLIGAIRANSPRITREIVDHLSTVLFVFKNCTLNIDEIGATFDSISNKDNNETKFAFAFTYGDIEIHINSLADMLQDDTIKNAADNRYAANYDIVKLNDTATGKNETKNFDDNIYDDGYNIGGLLKKIGSTIFHNATSHTAMGNIYDESWAGLVSNMLSTITTASTSSIMNSIYQTGRMHVTNAVVNKVTHNNDHKGNPTFTGKELDDNIYDSRDNGINPYLENNESEITELDNVYGEEPLPEPLLPDNVYPQTTQQSTQPSGYAYGTPPTPTPLGNDSVDMTAPAQTQLTSINVYGSIPDATHLTSTNIYGGVPATQPYYGEDADMSSNDFHENLGNENVGYYTILSNDLEPENVYEDLPDNDTENVFGNVYTHPIKRKAAFHINVYDRIVESISNPMPIEKIFGTPRPPARLQKEPVFPPIRTDKPEPKPENVYHNNESKPNKLKNDNVYTK